MRLRSTRIFLFTLLFCPCLKAQDVHVHVSPTSTGTTASTDDFPTIQMALDHAPDVGPRGRLYLHIAPGTYRERVWVSPLRARTTLLGTGSDPSEVVITAAQNAKTSQSTFFSETVEVNADGFQADNITFENTAGNTGQAVAIAVHSDRAIFIRCRFLGDQDTLLANFVRQYYVDSYIRGGVDFIFGNAAAVFEKSEIHIIRPGYLTAQSRTQPTQATGFVFQSSRVTADDFDGKAFYLGRPWRLYSRVVFLDTELPASLSPEGWSPWKRGDEPRKTFYAERNSLGPGARPESRVPWSHQLTARQATPFATRRFLSGKDHWNPVREAANLP